MFLSDDDDGRLWVLGRKAIEDIRRHLLSARHRHQCAVDYPVKTRLLTDVWTADARPGQ
jgi:hypothetical protein